MIAGILDAIVANKRAEVAAAKAQPIAEFAPRTPRDFTAALRQPGLSFITEVKRRSPSRGPLREDLDAAHLAAQYVAGGAAAISCLTDQKFFGARPDDLPTVARAVPVPVLRKDFIVDEFQIHDARRIGADAVLLIVRILEPAQLRDYLSLSREMGLSALVEVHADAELDTALQAGATIIGINNRDLDTLQVSLQTSLRLRSRIPATCIAVAESGISARADVMALEQAGFDAVLLGESLVTASHPVALLRELRGGRA